MGLYVTQQIPIQSYPPRIYLNGFPKSGLHLLELMVGELVSPSKIGRGGSEWLGMFKWHSFSNEMLDIRNTLWRLTLLERGDYLKGHMGHLKEIEAVMWWANIGHIMVTRDFRDVVVSTAYHILSDDSILRHQHKSLYGMLGGFDEVLSAVIEGLGPYPGLFERWEKYAGWTEIDWVMKVDFEELITQPEDCAKAFLSYCLYNATHLLGDVYGNIVPTEETSRELVRRMVESAKQTHRSTTFRKGKVGGWVEAFKDYHKDLFKKCDTGGWLVKMGYAKDDDW